MRWSGLALLVVAGLAAEGRADVLRILDDPRDAAQARVDIIQQARGGILAESYFGLGDEMNFVDRDVYVDGASALDAKRHFEALWTSRHVADLWTHVSAAEKKRAGELLDQAARELVCDGFLELSTGR